MKRVNINPIILFLIIKRKQMRITQETIAEQCNHISIRTLQRIEQGKAQIDLQQLQEYCAAVNTSLFDLLAIQENESHSNVSDVDILAIAKLLPRTVRYKFYKLMVEVVRVNRK